MTPKPKQDEDVNISRMARGWAPVVLLIVALAGLSAGILNAYYVPRAEFSQHEREERARADKIDKRTYYLCVKLGGSERDCQ